LSLHVPASFTSRCPCNLWTLACFAASSHRLCLMKFVSLRAEFCRQLPSDSTSQWTPLLLASGWRLHTPTVDSHHLVDYHARHTKKSLPCIHVRLLSRINVYVVQTNVSCKCKYCTTHGITISKNYPV